MAPDLFAALASDDPRVVETALEQLATLGRPAILAMQADEGEDDDDAD